MSQILRYSIFFATGSGCLTSFFSCITLALCDVNVYYLTNEDLLAAFNVGCFLNSVVSLMETFLPTTLLLDFLFKGCWPFSVFYFLNDSSICYYYRLSGPM